MMFKPPYQKYLDRHHRQHTNTEGISLRDWFAGQALAGLSSFRIPEGEIPGVSDEDLRRYKAQEAYHMADAVLAVKDEIKESGEPGETEDEQ